MTIVDVFFMLPLWAKIIVGVILFYLLVEALLMPYHANLRDNRYKDIQKTLDAILEASKANKKEFEDTQMIVSLLFGMLGKNKNDSKKDD